MTTATEAPARVDPIKEARAIKAKINKTRDDLEALQVRQDQTKGRLSDLDDKLTAEGDWRTRLKLGDARRQAEAEIEGIGVLRPGLQVQLSRLCHQLSEALSPWCQEAAELYNERVRQREQEVQEATARREAAEVELGFAQSVLHNAGMLASEQGAEWQGNVAVNMWPELQELINRLDQLQKGDINKGK